MQTADDGERLAAFIIKVLTDLPRTSPGLTEDALFASIKRLPDTHAQQDFSFQVRSKAVNSLLESSRIALFRRPVARSAPAVKREDNAAPEPDYELLYKLKAYDEFSEKTEKLTPFESLVLQIITDAATRGIWTRDIRVKAQLTTIATPILTKALKVLENKQLVKSFNPKNATTKKLYIRYHLKPDSDLTGGIFFSNSEFDEAFVEVISGLCETLLTQKYNQVLHLFSASDGPNADLPSKITHSYIPSKDILDTINRSDICQQKLAESDILQILNKLVFDNKAASIPTPQGASFRYCPPTPRIDALTAIPCGPCPVKSFCSTTKLNGNYLSAINPAACTYYKDWLSSF